MTDLDEEFTAAEWAEHREQAPHATVICNGEPSATLCTDYSGGLGFICRGETQSCGRYCCACMGGSDDNRCSECWVKHDKAQRRLPRRSREAAFQ